ncbi:MAG: CYTH domain-containing protein [Kiritimatiellales bacterium]
MKQEIERKFIVVSNEWRTAVGKGMPCRQGYFSTEKDGATVRIRRIGEQAWLTVKGPSQGISRPEFEYPVPLADADYMLEHLCRDRIVSKIRYTLEINGLLWEIDEFGGKNEGLILAEVELENENQTVSLPSWVGEEVSEDTKYKNVFLASFPYKKRP